MTKRVSQYEFPSAKNLSRTRSPFMTLGTAYQHLQRGSMHKVCWGNPSTCPRALTLSVKRINFFPFRPGYLSGRAAPKAFGVGRARKFARLEHEKRQGSSVVEQGTHKPLVGSSTLPPGIFENGMDLCSERNRPGGNTSVLLSICKLGSLSIGRGHSHATKRLGGNLQIVASKEVATLHEARRIERTLKAKKNPQSAICYLQR